MSKMIFVCYALERDHISELRERLHQITLGAVTAGYRAYAHVRDGQGWSFHQTEIRDVLTLVFAKIAEADVVLLDLTTHVKGYKRVGLNIEGGYAKALGKPIIAIWHRSERPNMTTDLADYEVSYQDVSELKEVTRLLLEKISDSSS